jgi:hypothetical protein
VVKVLVTIVFVGLCSKCIAIRHSHPPTNKNLHLKSLLVVHMFLVFFKKMSAGASISKQYICNAYCSATSINKMFPLSNPIQPYSRVKKVLAKKPKKFPFKYKLLNDNRTRLVLQAETREIF